MYVAPTLYTKHGRHRLGIAQHIFGMIVGGGAVGMSVWATVLASLGGAGRELLTSGEDLAGVITQVRPPLL